MHISCVDSFVRKKLEKIEIKEIDLLHPASLLMLLQHLTRNLFSLRNKSKERGCIDKFQTSWKEESST